MDEINFYERSIPEPLCFKIDFTIGPVVQKRRYKVRRATLMLMLTVDQTTTLRIQPKDSHGNVSKLDGVPSWSSSDESILTVVPAEDGLSAVVDVTGTIGGAQINVTADARLGDETRMLSGALDVQVVAGETAVIDIAADAPIEAE